MINAQFIVSTGRRREGDASLMPNDSLSGLREAAQNGFGATDRVSESIGHSRRMAAYQRAGIGLIYGDDGHWIADHLDGEERVRVQRRVDEAWSATHRHCPQSARIVQPAPGCFVRYCCPLCGHDTSLHPSGKVMPHAVRIVQPASEEALRS